MNDLFLLNCGYLLSNYYKLAVYVAKYQAKYNHCKLTFIVQTYSMWDQLRLEMYRLMYCRVYLRTKYLYYYQF